MAKQIRTLLSNQNPTMHYVGVHLGEKKIPSALKFGMVELAQRLRTLDASYISIRRFEYGGVIIDKNILFFYFMLQSM